MSTTNNRLQELTRDYLDGTVTRLELLKFVESHCYAPLITYIYTNCFKDMYKIEERYNNHGVLLSQSQYEIEFNRLLLTEIVKACKNIKTYIREASAFNFHKEATTVTGNTNNKEI